MANSIPEDMSPKDMIYIKEIEDSFFGKYRNTKIDFDAIYEAHGLPVRDAAIENICRGLLGESNDGESVYSFNGPLAVRFGNDYPTVKERHEEESLTWYDIRGDGITRKLPGVESDFTDVI